ncbi:MAG: glycosyltransferase family 2 protein [Acidobacteriota bacterium]|nr:glycosyltransferase family 2 protein [Acidobacteriota bacterium]
MSETKKVEIVFPCHNRREITLQCLRSLARIDKIGLEVHIVVVDDGSTDGTSEAIRREFPEVEIYSGDGNLWFTAGTNRGVEAALKHKPDYVLCINDDEIFDSRFLRRMVETAEANPRSIVGALLVLWDDMKTVFQVAPRWKTWQGGWRHYNQQTIHTVPNNPFEVGLIVGNCVLVPVEAIRECGLMDEKRFVNFGDAEWTPRMRKHGWKLLLEPRARVFCQPNLPPKSLRHQSWGELYQTLWADRRKLQNLRVQFRSLWVGAPTKAHAVAAFTTHIARLGLQSTRLWREKPGKEKTLAEDYA